MARHLIPSDATIRAIKPDDPRKRLTDGDGLVLLLFINADGEHGWRFDYRFGSKRNMLSLGTYPDTTLAIARRKADAVRHLLAEGFDPSQKRKAERETLAKVREADERKAQGLPPLDSFEAVARSGPRATATRSSRASRPTCSRGSASSRSPTSHRRKCSK
jgi:Arm DNA-binding domain